MKASLGLYSIGVGDRFARQAMAQLRACQLAAQRGVVLIPVWNKSNREHHIVGSQPESVRRAAQDAIRAAGWPHSWHVDADHIGLKTVDRFLAHSDFFTLDVADFIGQSASADAVKAFVDRHGELAGQLEISGLGEPFHSTRADVEGIAGKYLAAVGEAGRVYRHVEEKKGAGSFITEVSMDETETPQSSLELLVILAAIADEGIPIQTLAPKFTGRFNKGVDYLGDLVQFEKEFGADLAVVAHAVERYGLPSNLKLSVHSGSDKFSLYPIIRRALARTGAGLHLKTAGTTWLEEVIGLAESGGAGLELAKKIYAESLANIEELCAPYAAVIDIDRDRLPPAEVVQLWTPEQFVAALRHDPSHAAFNPHLRQLLHVGYKVAARMSERYLVLVKECELAIARNVTENLFVRHMCPLFPGVNSEK